MKKLTGPKCGMEVIGGSGFWGTSKPYCSFCGWNLQLAKEIERESLRQFPRNLLLFAGFFAFVGYLSKSGFAVFPFLFLSVFVVGGAIVSWRKLRLLEASHPTAVYTNALPSVMTVKDGIKQVRVNPHHELWNLTKPRRVQLKPVARIITVAFPISWIFIAYFGYQIARNQIAVAGPLVTFGDLALFLYFAFIWSIIGLTTMRSARRNRKLLAEGDVAMAIVTHQELIGGTSEKPNPI